MTKAISTGFYRETRRGREPIPEDIRTLAPAGDGAAACPAPAAPRGFGTLQPHGDAGHTGRAPSSPPPAPWERRWTVPLGPESGARWVLQAEDRILVQGCSEPPGWWHLLDLGGASMAHGLLGHGHLALDPERGLFYGIDLAGNLMVRSLDDGELAYRVPLPFAAEYRRILLARQGSRLVSAGVVAEVESHMRDITFPSVVEVRGIPDEDIKVSDGILLGTRPLARAYLDSHLLLAAHEEDTLALATENLLCLMATDDLAGRSAFKGEFTPLGLSLDEACQLHLLVRTPGGRELWRVNNQGELTMKVEAHAAVEAPPMVGHDHAVFLRTHGGIFKILHDGTTAWTKNLPGAMIGAVITPDHHLLVTHGNSITSLDPDGNEVATVIPSGDALTTPPVPTAIGQILVASSDTLHCLGQAQ